MKIKPSSFPNKNKQDLPVDITKERLERILGTRVSPEFVEWYRQDTKPGGFTTPGLKYQGPGNPTNIGEPVNYADTLAEKHDLQYAHASYKFSKNKVTKEEFEKRITKIDQEFLKNNAFNITSSINPLEQVSSIIGTAGIGIKYAAESVVGQKYPSTNPTTTFTGIPKEKANTNLTNKLMKNLKKNISTKSERVESSHMGIDNLKRPADSEGAEIPSKKTGNLPPPEPSLSADIEMANLTGTGKEQASGGASSDGMMVHYIERPISHFGVKESVYTKLHKVMTFGLAPNIINAEGATSSKWLTSYLAEIPWHIPAFFLNPSEFELISNGSQVKEVHIEVIYRGSTIQFETATTTSGIATLNQINDIAVATGLNRTGWGSNVRFKSFDQNEPMIPTALRRPTYGQADGVTKGMEVDYYGTENNTPEFTTSIPKHQLGRHVFLYNYWANSSRSENPIGSNALFGGWPCLAEKINQMDGKTVVNQVVLQSSYTPKMGLLKKPLGVASHGLPYPTGGESFKVYGLNTFASNRGADITAPSTVLDPYQLELQSKDQANVASSASAVEPDFTNFLPIEKSQYARSGLWGNPGGHIQPSLHIGVQPVPALSTAAILGDNQNFNKWTDTRAYWEIKATMIVTENMPTAWPYAYGGNVPMGEQIMFTPKANRPLAVIDPREDGATIAGLYTDKAPPLV
ncbi:capsid protein 1 [Duck-associated ambidensovirus 2]|nr:capsid protein 1 [Duck-associated ambidensovirus 2]